MDTSRLFPLCLFASPRAPNARPATYRRALRPFGIEVDFWHRTDASAAGRYGTTLESLGNLMLPEGQAEIVVVHPRAPPRPPARCWCGEGACERGERACAFDAGAISAVPKVNFDAALTPAPRGQLVDDAIGARTRYVAGHAVARPAALDVSAVEARLTKLQSMDWLARYVEVAQFVAGVGKKLAGPGRRRALRRAADLELELARVLWAAVVIAPRDEDSSRDFLIALESLAAPGNTRAAAAASVPTLAALAGRLSAAALPLIDAKRLLVAASELAAVLAPLSALGAPRELDTPTALALRNASEVAAAGLGATRLLAEGSLALCTHGGIAADPDCAAFPSGVLAHVAPLSAAAPPAVPSAAALAGLEFPAGYATPSPPPSRTKWTRRVPHPVLIGHAASLTPY